MSATKVSVMARVGWTFILIILMLLFTYDSQGFSQSLFAFGFAAAIGMLWWWGSQPETVDEAADETPKQGYTPLYPDQRFISYKKTVTYYDQRSVDDGDNQLSASE